MRKIFILLPIFGCLISCSTFDWEAFGKGLGRTADVAQAALLQKEATQLSGSVIIAGDGKYLGKITNQYATDSIFNEYGNFGSKYATSSIWNKYGTYGSKYSKYSPFNPYATSPPKIYKNGILLGYFTVNKYLANAINPYDLLSFFR